MAESHRFFLKDKKQDTGVEMEYPRRGKETQHLKLILWSGQIEPHMFKVCLRSDRFKRVELGVEPVLKPIEQNL
ncbi:unnamed protein product [Acanthoscelides obtectus]|uniref:Uncharacterized protein n=1 Tax=Acanthoscelides obtectus TaxID=200917 RepID=A0A9P0LUS0_ACAOB|nr:unnamed protein product [Acanthoscelides obtectus]CAK1668564.1 hypothetical protein AOBTE_LOCUS26486 [Acanthoscelides obtectus]